jgi:hypothetical protein
VLHIALFICSFISVDTSDYTSEDKQFYKDGDAFKGPPSEL